MRWQGVSAALVAAVVSVPAFGTTVLGPGTLFSHNPLGPTNQSSGIFGGPATNFWSYRNVRAGSSVGITTAQPRSGNGSLEFRTTNGVSKADVELYFPNAPVALSDVFGMSYDWYRDSSSAVAAHLHPAYRLVVTNGTQVGYLVFERAYNPSVSPVPTDTWVTETIGASTVLWATGSLPDAFSVYDRTLSGWQSVLSGYSVVGLSVGVGSGWTPDGSTMFVDNVAFRGTTYNFETLAEIPTPAAFMGGAVLMGMVATRRRK